MLRNIMKTLFDHFEISLEYVGIDYWQTAISKGILMYEKKTHIHGDAVITGLCRSQTLLFSIGHLQLVVRWNKL